MTEEERVSRIAALEEEKRGYEARGLDGRVKEVEVAIAALGGGPPVKRAERRPRAQGEQRA
jgi:hypothetical protein